MTLQVTVTADTAIADAVRTPGGSQGAAGTNDPADDLAHVLCAPRGTQEKGTLGRSH